MEGRIALYAVMRTRTSDKSEGPGFPGPSLPPHMEIVLSNEQFIQYTDSLPSHMKVEMLRFDYSSTLGNRAVER